MGQFYTTDKVKEILDAAPPHLDRPKILQTMVERGHEIEGLNTNFNPLGAVTNMPSSLVRFGKDIVTAVVNPKQTIEGISALGQGAFSKIADAVGVPINDEGRKKKEFFDEVVNQLVVQRYGSLERAAETIERDPAGFLADLATVVTGAGAVISGAGKVSKVGKLSQIGAQAIKIGRGLEPIGIATKVPVKVARAFNKATGMDKLLGKVSARFKEGAIAGGQRVFGLTDAEAKELGGVFGELQGKTTARAGIHGTPEEQLAQFATLEKHAESNIANMLSRAQDATFEISGEVRRIVRDVRKAIFGEATDKRGTQIKKTEAVLSDLKKENRGLKAASAEQSLDELDFKIDRQTERLEAMKRAEFVDDDLLAIQQEKLNLMRQRRARVAEPKARTERQIIQEQIADQEAELTRLRSTPEVDLVDPELRAAGKRIQALTSKGN
ncbi:MAG: hypothetical protein ACXABY_36945, partial [Candidatus Thorarchaeota archaeon]|jgi:hypothetical protein